MILQTLALAFPSIDPVAIHIGDFGIRWYSLAYIAGIVLGWWVVRYFNRAPYKEVIGKDALEDLMVWAVLGIVVGGRLGYVVFYNAGYYMEHPKEILEVWRGGMSFHGGLMGVLIAFALYCKKYKLEFLQVMDRLAIAAPIGLFFGRLANFANGELYGRVTDVSWGVIFPNGGLEPRHPSQLYEACLEGLVLFSIVFVLARFTKMLEKVGTLSGVFLIGYSTARAIVEIFREPDAQIGFLWHGITMGQLLSAPMWMLGAWLLTRNGRKQSGK